jgi:hypothetical protein
MIVVWRNNSNRDYFFHLGLSNVFVWGTYRATVAPPVTGARAYGYILC